MSRSNIGPGPGPRIAGPGPEVRVRGPQKGARPDLDRTLDSLVQRGWKLEFEGMNPSTVCEHKYKSHNLKRVNQIGHLSASSPKKNQNLNLVT